MNSRIPKKPKFDDVDSYLRQSKIPADNVLDLKKILVEQEKESQERATPKYAKVIRSVRHFRPFHFLPSISVGWRNIMIFGLVCLGLILPFFFFLGVGNINAIKGRVIADSSAALDNLKTAGSALTSLDGKKAQANFSLAENNFSQAQNELKKINRLTLLLIKLIPFKGDTVTSGQHLISAGQDIAQIGQLISDKIEPLTSTTAKTEEGDYAMPKFLFSLTSGLGTIEKKITEATDHLEKVNPGSLPAPYQEAMTKVLAVLPTLNDYVQQGKQLLTVATQLLGASKSQEYLFIFQNNQELRPTGGFIGSLALVKVDKGTVKILEVPGRGSYALNDPSLDIIPPMPLQLVNTKWQIQDANWFPDFPATAAKLNWFYEQARGFGVDGIISFTPEIVVDLLKITGPITMDKYQIVITSDNFIEETQKQVELQYNKEVNQPKQLIGDLMPILINKITQTKTKDLLGILSVFQKSFSQKDLLVYVKDNDLENKIKSLGLAGEIKVAPKDYLMVINTNIGGGKTDGVIKQEIKHKAVIQTDGSVIDTVTIKRTHQGDPQNIYTKVKNIDYLRVYVPEGSELLESGGFSKMGAGQFMTPDSAAKSDTDLLATEQNPIIDERTNTRVTAEFSHTCFANWFNLEVMQSGEVTLTYRLPFKLTGDKQTYSLFIQKQPGAKPSDLTSTLTYAADYKITDQSPENITVADNTAKYQASLSEDQIWGVALQKN